MSDQRRTASDSPPPAFDLKGTVLSATVLRLHTDDVDRIERELKQRTAQLPHFFDSAPVVLDCGALAGGLPFAALAEALRRCGLVPVGVRNVGSAGPKAVAAGFGLLKEAPRPRAARPDATAGAARSRAGQPNAPDRPPVRQEATAVATPAPSLTINKPVRSGQVIHAQQTDLVLLAAVNPGAEVIADGNVHAYAPLRGRVLAGAGGNQDVRIFAHQLSAELVSVAGHYLRADQLPEDLRGKPAQVLLKDGLLVVLPL